LGDQLLMHSIDVSSVNTLTFISWVYCIVLHKHAMDICLVLL
jgi:hypothetical protein